jgi:arylformamidase
VASPNALLFILKEVKRMAEDIGSRPDAPKSEWIDISYPLSEDMIHWPQDPVPPDIKSHSHTSEEGTITMSQMTINTHHGTHIDAPRHFFPDGTPVDEMPLGAIMGPARVIEIKDTESIKPEELAAHDIQPGERILFKTVNSSYYKLGKFVEDFVYISNEAAQFLKDKKVSVIGIDYLAIGSFKDRPSLLEVHRTILGNGIWVIEALDLSAVKAGRYEIICLPIKIKQGDAGQARAIVRLL